MKKPGYHQTLSFLFSLFILFASGCSGQSKLPGNWQPGMELKLTYGGGMRYYSSEIVIKETGSYRLVNDAGKEKKDELTFSQKELDELAVFLRTKSFDQIRSHERDGIIYDMGTTSITLHVGNKIYEVSVGATRAIPETDAEAYSAIRQYITQMTDKKQAVP
jgi:hypothetical protein